jgi:hypothetical protein
MLDTSDDALFAAGKRFLDNIPNMKPMRDEIIEAMRRALKVLEVPDA